jgi:alkylated DNA repair dioxygenase AlkB
MEENIKEFINDITGWYKVIYEGEEKVRNIRIKDLTDMWNECEDNIDKFIDEVSTYYKISKKELTDMWNEINSIFIYDENFIDDPDDVFERLIREIPFEQRQVKVYGKEFNEPRLTSVHGDDDVMDKKYIYSKSVRELKKMTPTLKKIQDKIEDKTGIHFDFVLINLYRNGNDKVGWHSDNEKMMDCSNIVSISLGAERKFKFRTKDTHKLVWEKRLGNGSMVWMKPGCQELYEHEVPKEAKINDPRINLTFRRFVN